MNNVVLIGRLTADPELRFLPGNGQAVATFTLAVDKDLPKTKKKEFEEQGKPTADFIRVVTWRHTAEYVSNYTVKGKLIAVQGRIQTRSFDNKEGQRVYVTEVVSDQVQILEWGNSKDNGVPEGFMPIDDDDIPF